MAHWDLLPKGSELIQNLVEDDRLDEESARNVLRTVAYHLGLYRDYYQDQYRMNGEKQDLGATEALDLLAADLSEAARI